MIINRLCYILFLLSHPTLSQPLAWQNIPPKTDASFRGLSVVDNQVAWASGTKGTVGRSLDGGQTWQFNPVKTHEKLDFRSLYAFDPYTALIANAGSPAHILRTTDGGQNWEQVYINTDTAAFFDGIDFWNPTEGIAFGDPIQGKMLILLTHNAGKTWEELPPANRPSLEPGEASFAASGTTIRCGKAQQVTIATGGKVSRLWRSSDGGKTWKSYPTPILQGQNSTGIFSFALSGIQNGLIVGGDYLKDSLRKEHVFYTLDGGKNWLFPAQPTRGYRECVEFLSTKTAIATGPSGSDFTGDGGKTWKPLSDEKGFHVVRKARNGTLILAVGGKGKIAVLK